MSLIDDNTGRFTPEEQQRWLHEAGRWQLQQLLFWRWDPIGISDHFPSTVNEYDSYVDPIASLLEQEAGVDEIAAYLRAVEEADMELGREDGSNDRTRSVAQLIADWHRNSMSHWLAFRVH